MGESPEKTEMKIKLRERNREKQQLCQDFSDLCFKVAKFATWPIQTGKIFLYHRPHKSGVGGGGGVGSSGHH